MSHKENKESKSTRKKDEVRHSSPSPSQRQPEILKYPPINQAQFRATVIDFLLSDHFDYPVSANELFFNITDCFKTKTNTPFLRNLQIVPILKQLGQENAVVVEQLPVGITMQEFILAINLEKLRQLNIQYSKDRPRKMPSYEEWIDQETKSIQMGVVRKIETLLEEGSNLKGATTSLLPRIAAQKKRIMQEVDNKKGDKGEVKLMYEENVVQLALERKRIGMLKGSAAFDEEEAKRKFAEKGVQICEFCTREKCNQSRGSTNNCTKTHFKKMMKTHTISKLGNCPNLDQCQEQEICKFIHYFLEHSTLDPSKKLTKTLLSEKPAIPAQWINCDLRIFDFRVLGKFDVVMADPPWDIHMNLPYGTLKDKEMKALRVDLLQDDGVIFLWVTGRAMELGRECLQLWGYRRVEELVWIKINTMQRIIRTGRTGHWLNHSKEHCLVGIKGNPSIVRALDCDVLVSEVRETSRKPDEIYGLIQRMSPNGKKVELFGRPHNCRENWVTLGNQLPGVYLEDEDICKRFNEAFPQVDISKEAMLQNLQQMYNEENINVIYNNHIGLNRKLLPPPNLPGIESKQQSQNPAETIQQIS